MNGDSFSLEQIWPMGLFMAASLAIAGAMIGVSFLLGQRHSGRTTGEPYESGMPVTGEAHQPFTIKYYLVAIFFVIFDVEAVFIFAWAVALRELGWQVYGAVLIFIAVLLLLLFYLWRKGALDWGGAARKGLREGGEHP